MSTTRIEDAMRWGRPSLSAQIKHALYDEPAVEDPDRAVAVLMPLFDAVRREAYDDGKRRRHGSDDAMYEAVRDAISVGGSGYTDAEDYYDGVANAALEAMQPFIEQARREAHAEHAPDVSGGDVIHAEPDGTIMLDDGITTWNPARATAWLIEQERAKLRRIAPPPAGIPDQET